jgi:hypothetical protein
MFLSFYLKEILDDPDYKEVDDLTDHLEAFKSECTVTHLELLAMIQLLYVVELLTVVQLL